MPFRFSDIDIILLLCAIAFRYYFMAVMPPLFMPILATSFTDSAKAFAMIRLFFISFLAAATLTLMPPLQLLFHDYTCRHIHFDAVFAYALDIT